MKRTVCRKICTETAVEMNNYHDIRMKSQNRVAETSARIASKYSQFLPAEYKKDASLSADSPRILALDEIANL
jgi:hypothetical protein